MDLVEYAKSELARIVYNDDGHAAVQRWTQFPLWYKDYGKTWLAYAYHPVHIDREKWEPCEWCGE